MHTYGHKMDNHRIHQHSVHSFLPGNSAYRNSGQTLPHSPLHAPSYNCRLSKYQQLGAFWKIVNLPFTAVYYGITIAPHSQLCMSHYLKN